MRLENIVRPREVVCVDICPLGFAFKIAMPTALMDTKLFEHLFSQWKQRELSYQRIGKRKYLHFDRHIQFHKNIQWFKHYLKNSTQNIPSHGFYPFIKSDIVTPRIKHEKDQVTGKKYIYKSNKVRPIAYASHFDAFIYSWYATVLNYYYLKTLKKEGIEECVLAYIEKSGKCNIDFADEAFGFIEEGYVALAFDLSSYFDGLDHEILKEKWCKILDVTKLPIDHFKVFNTLTNYTFVRREELDVCFPPLLDKGVFKDRICSPKQFRDYVKKELIEKNEFYNKICSSSKFGIKCGIPQGSPISACLSNIYLIDFDKTILFEAIEKKAFYRRYCDDLLLICKEEDWNYFKILIESTIKQYEVEINKDKTEVVFFKRFKDGVIRGFDEENKFKNLQYLGFEFNGQNKYIRSSSMSRYFQKMSAKVKQAVEDAYCEEFGQKDFIFRKKILKRYSEQGNRNFITYGYRAGKNIMDSKTVINQIKKSSERIENLLNRINKEKHDELVKDGLVVKMKK